MFVLVYNITKRLKQNASIEDELAKHPITKISSSRTKGEKFHPWLERNNSVDNSCNYSYFSGGVIQIVPTIMVKSIFQLSLV
jgi:cytochrome c oxidase cbb3-type subunit I/II